MPKSINHLPTRAHWRRITDTPPDERTRFALAYLEDLDVTRAAGHAGMSVETARRLAASTSFQRELDALRGYRSRNVHIYAENVLRRWWQVGTADVRELIELRRPNCRYCHGTDHRMQRTQEELRQAFYAHVVKQEKLPEHQRTIFDDEGGSGYNRWADPDPECPECWGHGVEAVYMHDSRTLSPSAAALLAGYEINTKTGACRVLTRDQDKAMDSVAAHLGMRVERHAHLHAALDPATMSDEQLDVALEAFGRAAPGEPVDVTPDHQGGDETVRAGGDDRDTAEPQGHMPARRP